MEGARQSLLDNIYLRNVCTCYAVAEAVEEKYVASEIALKIIQELNLLD